MESKPTPRPPSSSNTGKTCCQRACRSLWQHARASDYNAKVLLLFVLYVVVLVFSLPESLALIHTPNTASTLDSRQDSTSWVTYFYLIFIPFIKLITHFAANFIGIMALIFAFILSERFRVLRHYALLFLLYLVCAYPSLQCGGEIFPTQWFLGVVLQPLALLQSGDYVVLFAYYGKGIVWVFLVFAVFDMVFALLQSRNSLDNPSKKSSNTSWAKIPRLAYENLAFALVLYGAVFGIYSYDSGAIVLY